MSQTEVFLAVPLPQKQLVPPIISVHLHNQSWSEAGGGVQDLPMYSFSSCTLNSHSVPGALVG